jgi:hypothetical protein
MTKLLSLRDDVIEFIDAAIPHAMLALVATDPQALRRVAQTPARPAIVNALLALDDDDFVELLTEAFPFWVDHAPVGDAITWARRFGLDVRRPTIRATFYAMVEAALMISAEAHVAERAREFQPATERDASA